MRKNTFKSERKKSLKRYLYYNNIIYSTCITNIL